MMLNDVMKNLFTNKKADWIMDIEENEVQPYIIQRCLAMNDALRVQTRWLDKYTFSLPSKMYLSLAWSVLPKTDKTPYSKYIKPIDETEEFDFILNKVRKHLQLADNDYNAIKGRLVKSIKDNMAEWFSFYGIPKRYWKQYYLDFRLIKKLGTERIVPQKGLEAWGL